MPSTYNHQFCIEKLRQPERLTQYDLQWKLNQQKCNSRKMMSYNGKTTSQGCQLEFSKMHFLALAPRSCHDALDSPGLQARQEDSWSGRRMLHRRIYGPLGICGRGGGWAMEVEEINIRSARDKTESLQRMLPRVPVVHPNLNNLSKIHH